MKNKQKWIDFKKEKPKSSGRVLIAYKKCPSISTEYVIDCSQYVKEDTIYNEANVTDDFPVDLYDCDEESGVYFFPEGFWGLPFEVDEYGDNHKINEDIEFWMPLPEPPINKSCTVPSK